ncbi:MAG: immune inhibitor A [Candidatus Eisenbacteria bacterium]|nr:immune inhibitor A [Candidatus Eisenbacteria bacterium]
MMDTGRHFYRLTAGLCLLLGIMGILFIFQSNAEAASWTETHETLLRALEALRGPKTGSPLSGSPEAPAFEALNAAGVGAELRAQDAAPEPKHLQAAHQAFPNGLVTWDGERPHRILLGGDIRADEKSLDGLIQASLRLIKDHSTLFPVASEDLVLESKAQVSNLWFLIFQQHELGLPVEGGRLDFRWTIDGRLAMLGSDLRNIRPLNPHPTLSEDEAIARAAGAIDRDPQTLIREAVYPVIVPDGEMEQVGDRVAWRMLLRAPGHEYGWWAVWVDAHSGELLNVRNLIHDSTPAAGSVEIYAERFQPGDIMEVFPGVNAMVALKDQGGTLIETTFTDPDGSFDFGDREELDLSYFTMLAGPYCVIKNSSMDDRTPELEIPVGGTGADTLRWYDDGSTWPSERDAFVHLNIAHDITKAWDPGWFGLDFPLSVYVENTDGICNGYYAGDHIVFYAPGGSCPSIGQIADVAYHEYAHGITGTLYWPEFGPADSHEGYSDYYGATITNNPKIGQGFTGPGSYLRDIDEDLVYPDDISGEPHHDGIIISGAFWDLRTDVGPATADYLYHFHRYGKPMNYDDALIEVLIVDDDDGNIYNGTPHFDSILTAFRAHGIGDTSIRIQHNRLPDTEAVNTEIALDATILSLYGLDADSLRIYYRVASTPPVPYTPVDLMDAGGIRNFSAIIPGQSAGTMIEYYISAADTMDHRSTLPAEAPETVYSFYVGTDTVAPTFVMSPLWDGTVDQDSFRVEVDVTDNSARVGSVQIRYLRPSDQVETTKGLTLTEGSTYRAYISPGALSVGDSIPYRIEAIDAAQTPNTGAWPALDQWEAFHLRAGTFNDLESDNGGYTADGDWEWGNPDPIQASPYSGGNVWATGLTNNYSTLVYSMLQLPELDLTAGSGWDRATLEFQHFYKAEWGYDGGQIQVSRNGGQSFRPLTPRGGYPHRNVDAYAGPAYTGDSDGWERVEVPLDNYIGESIVLGFLFGSDVGVEEPGWFLDDIRIVQRQTLAEPADLSADSGWPDRIPLSWSKPPGINTSGDPFLGYNIYRSTTSGQYGTDPLNTAPLQSTQYHDTSAAPMTDYFYIVTALYDEDESLPSNEAMVTSYQAIVSMPYDTLSVVIDGTTDIDTTLTISNAGAGSLNYTVFLADADQDFDDIRLIYTLGSATPDDLVLLHEDPDDNDSTPDIAGLFAGDDDTEVTFLITEYEAHGNPASDFSVVLELDTDLDISTGMPDLNLGADFTVVVGALANAYGFYPGFILNGEGEIAGFPNVIQMDSGGDSIRIALPLSLLGDPTETAVSSFVIDAAFDLVDSQPDPLMASWLSCDAYTGSATPTNPGEIMVTMAAADLPDGDYAARLIIETNDINQPILTVEVKLGVGFTPTFLSFLDFNSLTDGLEIVWSPPIDIGVDGFRLYRRDGVTPGEELISGPTPLRPGADGSYTFFDQDVEPGHSYEYHFVGVHPDGSSMSFGSDFAVFSPEIPQVLSLMPPRPVPFRSQVTLRFGIPKPGEMELAIFDVRGRRVTTLCNGPSKRGVFERTWDARDASGHPVGSGVYFGVLRQDHERRVRRLVLTR